MPRCLYCGSDLEIVTYPVHSMNYWIAWGRCNSCGLSAGCKSASTEEAAKEDLFPYLEGKNMEDTDGSQTD